MPCQRILPHTTPQRIPATVLFSVMMNGPQTIPPLHSQLSLAMPRNLLLLCLLVPPAVVNGENWTRFHGPNGAGVSEAEGIPTKFDKQNFNWKVKLPGTGHSSPVIWGQKIFLLCSNRSDASRQFVCLRVKDGKILWKREFQGDVHRLHKYSSFASCTPTVDAERVYVAWSSPDKTTLMAFRHDGDLAWEKDLGTWSSRHGFGTSPMLYRDLLILSNSQRKSASYVMAFDKKTGKERWRRKRRSNSVSYSTPCIFTPKAGRPQLVCCNTGDGMFGLDPQTGKEIWALKAFKRRTVSSPVIVGDLIFGSTGSGGGGNYVVAVKPPTTLGRLAELKYEVKSQAPYVPTSVAKGGMLFLWSDGGIATCLEAATGKVHWRKRIGGNFYGSPIRIGNAVYNVSTRGEVVAFAATKKYQLLGKSQLEEVSHSTLAVANGRLFIRTLSHLISIGGQAAE